MSPNLISFRNYTIAGKAPIGLNLSLCHMVIVAFNELKTLLQNPELNVSRLAATPVCGTQRTFPQTTRTMLHAPLLFRNPAGLPCSLGQEISPSSTVAQLFKVLRRQIINKQKGPQIHIWIKSTKNTKGISLGVKSRGWEFGDGCRNMHLLQAQWGDMLLG